MTVSIESARTTIAARNDELRAVLHVLKKPLQNTSNPRAPLGDLPYVLKDVWDTAGIPTTGGSFRHKDRVPTESSRIFVALQETGAALLGKSNLCDMAFSMESDNHIFGPVRNPIDPSRTAGGSTGGGAAAVASGMAAFDWGTDFGGSIRLPAAFCGVVGLRLSAKTWPVDREHFPRISPKFYSFCGMGPLARDVATARRIVAAVAPALGAREAYDVDSSRVFLYSPDAAHLGRWPTFERDAKALLDRAGVDVSTDHALPPPSHVNETFGGYVASHFMDFIGREELSFADGLAATALGVLTNGRLDKRLHPVSASLFALVGLGKLVRYRDPAPQIARLESLREAARRAWSTGRLIVSPTTTALPPKHGRAVLALRAPSFVMLGNLVDATAIAIPFGRFAGTTLPRSLQILGPPGSEDAVLDLAARLEGLVSTAA
ncbi:MAG TPA: amidase [Polyangiaceae bacterium]|jgi:Asp-tRNA(Asn)/Glu-tRNA(Gln) amidotransferase A subunit family amidase